MKAINCFAKIDDAAVRFKSISRWAGEGFFAADKIGAIRAIDREGAVTRILAKGGTEDGLVGRGYTETRLASYVENSVKFDALDIAFTDRGLYEVKDSSGNIIGNSRMTEFLSTTTATDEVGTMLRAVSNARAGGNLAREQGLLNNLKGKYGE